MNYFFGLKKFDLNNLFFVIKKKTGEIKSSVFFILSCGILIFIWRNFFNVLKFNKWLKKFCLKIFYGVIKVC